MNGVMTREDVTMCEHVEFLKSLIRESNSLVNISVDVANEGITIQTDGELDIEEVGSAMQLIKRHFSMDDDRVRLSIVETSDFLNLSGREYSTLN